MRHRMTDLNTGLGNSETEKLINNGKLTNKKFWDKFLEDAQKNFTLIREVGGFDFTITENGFAFGIEPAYQMDRLEIIYIAFDKEQSYWRKGIAMGVYGSHIVETTKYYKDYKNKSKFIKFIDRWADKVKEELSAKKCKK